MLVEPWFPGRPSGYSRGLETAPGATARVPAPEVPLLSQAPQATVQVHGLLVGHGTVTVSGARARLLIPAQQRPAHGVWSHTHKELKKEQYNYTNALFFVEHLFQNFKDFTKQFSKCKEQIKINDISGLGHIYFFKHLYPPEISSL